MKIIDDISYDPKYEGVRITCVGDSLTDAIWNNINYQYGRATPFCHWTSLTALQTGCRMVNLGAAGAKTDYILSVVRSSSFLTSNPTHCIIMGGVNDCFTNVNTNVTMSNIKQMVLYCKTNNIIPIIMDCPVYSSDGSAVNLLSALHIELQRYTAQEKIHYINLFNSALMQNGKQMLDCYLEDLVHLSNKGNGVIGSELISKLDTILV